MTESPLVLGAIIERLFGAETAQGIAIGAEYTWHRDADADPFAEYLNSATF